MTGTTGRSFRSTRPHRNPRPLPAWLPGLVLALLSACAPDSGGDAGRDVETDAQADAPAELSDNPQGDIGAPDVPDGTLDPGPFAASPLRVEVIPSPPGLVIRDLSGRVVAETMPGILRLARVVETFQWDQGFLAVKQEVQQVVDPADGTAELVPREDAWAVTLRGTDGRALARLVLFPEPTGLRMEPAALPDAGEVNQVRFRFRCRDGEAFFGFGGQNDAVDHRGCTIPVRSTEQGLGKDPEASEDVLTYPGHLHDTYFPLPYAVVATAGPEARAHGLLLESSYRSRFLLCTEAEPGATEIQVALADLGGLRVLAGPTPKDVVRQFTDHHGRPNPVPDWAFGPWVALLGEPLSVATQADRLDVEDIPLSAVWDMDYRDYEHPDLPAMIAKIHAMGLRVLTYFNPFLDQNSPMWEQAQAEGWLPHREDGSPYVFQWYNLLRSFVDLTDKRGWEHMRRRLDFAWDLGLDGWMADYGEWVIPDMHFDNGMTGWRYGNLYPVDWARIHRDALDRKRSAGDGLFFSRSGFLDSNRHLSVVWAGDQQTDWDPLDGIGSVIPYGTGLGLSGVSAFGHDIAGYTGLISPPSTKELYFRWTELGAWSPVMRTHRGDSDAYNWDWNRDTDTIAHFRSYALLHLRMLPYLVALHAEAMATGTPAMRSVVLEFPAWRGARDAVHDFLLGPAFFVAPVIEEGALTREVRLPPGRWWRYPEGTPVDGDRVVTEDAPLPRIPVFLRTGGVAALLPDTVRRVEPTSGWPSIRDARTIQARRLEILVGPGADGTLSLADGAEGVEATRIMASEDPAATVASAGDTPLAPCAGGQDPWEADCVGVDGAWWVVPRTGPGSVRAGGMAVSVTGGPSGRRYLVRIPGAEPPPPWWTRLSPGGPRVREVLGVSSHMAQGPGPDANRDFELARYAELGGLHVRNDFLWQWIEPERGRFHFEAVEAGVDAVLGTGGSVTAILDYGVSWAMPDGTPGSIDPADYAAFAGAMAGHFCGRIGDFEVWNEPNLDTFWPPGPDPVRYGALLRAAYGAVKAACPQARVLTGGLSSADSMLGWQFYRDLGAAMPDVCDHFDVLAIHPYTFDQALPPERDVRTDDGGYLFPGQSAMTAMARQRLADWGCPDRPIHITEMGWPSYTVREEDQGRWLARSVLLAVRDGVEVYEWYTFWDGEPITNGPRPHENYFGLFGWPGDPESPRRPKPAWVALKGLATVLGEARFAGDVSAALGMPNDVHGLAFRRDDGAIVLAAWDGREVPDLGPDGEEPGGPGTTWRLALPLPPGSGAPEVRDLDGTLLPVRATAPRETLVRTLTPRVQYIVLPPG